MKIKNLRKETSERSDAANWAKQSLIDNTTFFFDSIEGCNQNTNNIVTHLLERARFDVGINDNAIDDIYKMIIDIETIAVLTRKINFANLFSIPLSYVLYCDETETVYLLNFKSISKLEFINTFYSYQAFSDWISEIKGWKSNKSFRENPDLPEFDKRLRKCGTAWPTNLDCFFSDENNNPLGLIEYQNADRVGVQNHCNNDYFLCKMSSLNQWGHNQYHDDIRRWTSQEIIRVQSKLRYFIITWSTLNYIYTLKEIEKITIPHFPSKPDGKPDWDFVNKYKAAMNAYSNNKNINNQNKIEQNGITFNFSINNHNQIITTLNSPPLNFMLKTFPSIYYLHKKTSDNTETILGTEFKKLF
jgi:hypothetical protein